MPRPSVKFAPEVQHLAEQLRRTGEYHTNPAAGAWLDRMMGWSDAWYYARQIGVIYTASFSVLLGRFGKRGWAARAYQIMQIIECCGGRINITGIEHVVKRQAPAVYVANHMSMMETMLLPGLFILPFHDVTTVVKESLTTHPIFGRVMRDIGCIAVGRENPREDFKRVMEQGSISLAAGCSVMLFPQATRMIEFDASQFNSLGVKLARQAGVPVVPVALRTDFHGVGRVVREIGKVDRSKSIHFKFGPALPVEGNGRETHQKVLNFIGANLREWGVKVVAAGADEPKA